MIFLVGQGLGRADYNGVASVDANGIQVFHIAYGNGCIIPVPHHFVFDFLKAPDAFFNQYFPDGGEGKGMLHQRQEFCLVFRKTAAGSAQGESWT